MNNFKSILLTLLILLIGSPVSAQQKQFTVKGKVMDPYTNAPVAGALVGATGLAVSVTTNDKGEFSFDIPSLRGQINFWAVGYYTSEMPIMGRTNIDVVLIPLDKFGFSENVQVPMQGSVKAADNVAKSSSIDNNNINANKTRVEQIFLDIPGIRVIDKSGMPGEGSYFDIRGISSFNSKTAPLIILDGMPVLLDMNESPVITGYSRGILNSINPRDIKNITVLKGADAALYGSMGSNGVIMIETDKAVDLDTKVEFIGQYGVNMNQIKMPLLNIPQYKNYVNSVAVTQYPTDGAAIKKEFPFLIQDPTDPLIAYNDYIFNNNTDWQDLIYRPGFMTDNVLKIKGGDAIAKFDISAGYHGNAGQVENTSFDKYYMRMNSDVNLSRRLSLFTTFSSAYMNSTLMEQGMSVETNPLLAAMSKSPMLSPYKKEAGGSIMPVFAPVGSLNNTLGESNNLVSNPLAIVNDIDAEARVYDINANGGLNYKINDAFNVLGSIGIFYNSNRETIFIPGVTNTTIMPLQGGVAKNTSRIGTSQTMNIYYALNGTYVKNIANVHDIRASVGVQATTSSSEYGAGEGSNSPSDFFKTLDNTQTVGRRFFGYNDHWNWLNFNARAQYVYNRLIGVGAVVAADRSSAIGVDAKNLYGVYPAVNGALYLKNSPLLNNVRFVNKFTVRADYTSTGNSQFATEYSKYYYTSSRFGNVSGIVRAGVPNLKLGPELTNTISAGVDISLFNHRLDISAEYYYAKSTDLIMQREISPSFGTDYMYDNIGSALNEGYDISAQLALVQMRSFKWHVGGTISHNANKILSLGGADQIVLDLGNGAALVNKVGLPMNTFYGYKTDGVWSSTSEALASNLTNFNGNTFSGGDVRFIDLNNDKTIDSKDRTYLGSANPKFFGTVFTNFQYKAFTLSAVIGYSYGNKAYNATRRFMEAESDYRNQYASVASRWIMDGQVTDMPRADYGDPMQNNRFSDRFVEDASYAKIKELMISYRLPAMNGVTLFAAGENLYTWTNYLGLDPEFAYSYNSTLLGVDFAKIANARTVKFGVKIQF